MPATTVTLTTAATAYRIHDLITGTTGGVGHAFPNAPRACRELSITGDPGNGAAKVFFGDASVSAADFGVQLIAGQGMLLRSDKNDICLIGKFLCSDIDAAKADVHWECA